MTIAGYATRLELSTSSQTGINKENIHWLPPPMSVLVNNDGSFHNLTKFGGISLTIGDFAGRHKSSKCIHLAAADSAEHAECKRTLGGSKMGERFRIGGCAL